MTTDAKVGRTLEACKQALHAHYGCLCAGLVLYGSEAEGHSTPLSDIDLLVLLDEPFDFFRELDVIVDLLYPIQLQSDRHISARPVSRKDFETGTLQLYRNAKEYGIAV